MGTKKLTPKEYDQHMQDGMLEDNDYGSSFAHIAPTVVDYDTYKEQMVDGTFDMVSKYLVSYTPDIRMEVLCDAEGEVRTFVDRVERCNHDELLPLLDGFLKGMFQKAEVLHKEKIIRDIDLLKQLVYTAPSKAIRDQIRDFTREVNERIDRSIFMSGKASDSDIYLIRNLERMYDFLKENRKWNFPEEGLNTDKALVFSSFKDIVVNTNTLEEVYKILISNGIIDTHHVLKGTSTKLYSSIKKMKKLGYFKPTSALTNEKIHTLTNQEFHCQATYNLYKNVDLAKDIPLPRK